MTTTIDKSLVSRIRAGIAADEELRALSGEDLYAIKSEKDAVHRRFSVAKAFGISLDERMVRGVPHSTERRDRVGDIIKVSGWELADYKENAVILYGHSSHSESPKDSFPVAKALRPRTGRSSTGMRALLIDERYHEEEISPNAELVWRMVAADALPGRSVGFIPIETLRPEDEKEREKLGLGPWGVLYAKAELIESSVVPVPCNADALQGKGFVEGCYSRARSALRRAVEDGLMSWTEGRRVADWLPITDEDAAAQERSARRAFIALPKEFVAVEKASKVQSVLVPTDGFTRDEAKTWVEEHGFTAKKIDETDDFFRFRQFPPDDCTKDPRMITLSAKDGVKAVICETEKAAEGAEADEPSDDADVTLVAADAESAAEVEQQIVVDTATNGATAMDTVPTYTFRGPGAPMYMLSVEAASALDAANERLNSLAEEIISLREQNVELALSAGSLARTVEELRGARGDASHPERRPDASEDGSAPLDYECIFDELEARRQKRTEEREAQRRDSVVLESAMPRLRAALLRHSSQSAASSQARRPPDPRENDVPEDEGEGARGLAAEQAR